MICQNCQNSFQGEYCGQCGQRAIANHKLNFRELLNDLVDNVFNLHKGLLFTLSRLLSRPGKFGRAYLGGERKRYTNPVRFLIIAVAYQAFIDYWFLHPELVEQPDFIYLPFLSEDLNSSMAVWNHTLATRFSFVHNLSMILIFPLAFTLLFRKSGYNFTELLTVNFYYFSTGLILTVSTILGYTILASEDIPTAIIILITMSYVVWSSMAFFKSSPFLIRLLKVMAALVFFMIFRVFLLVYLLSLIFPVTRV